MKWESPSETLGAFVDRFVGKPYSYADPNDTQDDYILAGDKDAPEGEAFPVTPSVMK
jgi:hypothetical protein